MPVVGIFVTLVLGLAGSLVPPLINAYLPKFDLNNRYAFRFFNGLAAGVVLGVACIPLSFYLFSLFLVVFHFLTAFALSPLRLDRGLSTAPSTDSLSSLFLCLTDHFLSFYSFYLFLLVHTGLI